MKPLSISRINAPKFGGGLIFERKADHHQRRENELRDLVQCGIDDWKIVLAFLVHDQYVNINSMEDLITTESLVKE